MKAPMKRLLGLLAVAVTALASPGCQGSETAPPTIVVGSKNFTEQVILGELLAQQIEARTGLRVSRKLNLGGTLICHQALVAGEIHAYVEYTGTALTAILQESPSINSDAVFQTVQRAYRQRFDLEWLPPLGFTNTFAILIRGADAARLGIKTISDLVQYAPRWRAGFGYEFLERPDGFPGLARVYGLRFAQPPRVMDLALTYQALADKQVDVIAGDSTNGLIASLGLAVLIDDKQFFPAYQAAPVISRAMAERVPQFRDALVALAGTITNEEMRRLNYEVDGKRRNVREVVTEFRIGKGL